MRVILGLLIWSLAEISALVVVGRWIGLLAVLTIVLGSGVAGVMLLRRQGVRLAGAMRGRGGLQGMGEAGLLAFGAVLLIMPGLLTDLAGLALMVPQVRRWLARRIGGRVVVAASHDAANDVVEAVAVEVVAGEVEPDAPGAIKVGPPSGWTKP